MGLRTRKGGFSISCERAHPRIFSKIASSGTHGRGFFSLLNDLRPSAVFRETFQIHHCADNLTRF